VMSCLMSNGGDNFVPFEIEVTTTTKYQ
jgi:hypothetical protein